MFARFWLGVVRNRKRVELLKMKPVLPAKGKTAEREEEQFRAPIAQGAE